MCRAVASTAGGAAQAAARTARAHDPRLRRPPQRPRPPSRGSSTARRTRGRESTPSSRKARPCGRSRIRSDRAQRSSREPRSSVCGRRRTLRISGHFHPSKLSESTTVSSSAPARGFRPTGAQPAGNGRRRTAPVRGFRAAPLAAMTAAFAGRRRRTAAAHALPPACRQGAASSCDAAREAQPF